jgi:tetratricopeptide (TPR) repeat protein
LRAALKREGRVQVLRGAAGLGKTMVAMELAEQVKGDYNWIVWLRAGDEKQLVQSLGGSAVHLGFDAVAKIRDIDPADWLLTTLSNRSDWLLIADDVRDFAMLARHLPAHRRGPILVTTRERHFEPVSPYDALEMTGFEDGEAFDFVLKRTERSKPGVEETKAVDDLCRELGHLPLALEQAAGFMYRNGISAVEYLAQYKEKRLAILEQIKPLQGHYVQGSEKVGASVATTLLFELQSVSAEQAVIWHSAAILGTDPIPYKLFEKAGPEIGLELGGIPFERLLTPLIEARVLEDDRGNRQFHLSTLMRELMRSVMTDEERLTALRQVGSALIRLTPEETWGNHREIGGLITHLQAVGGQMEDFDPEVSVRLYVHAIRHQSAVQVPGPIVERAYRLASKTLGLHHELTIETLYLFGFENTSKGAVKEGLEKIRSAMELAEAYLKPDSPVRFRFMLEAMHIGAFWETREQANHFRKRAYEVALKHLGPNHVQTLEFNAAMTIGSRKRTELLRPILESLSNCTDGRGPIVYAGTLVRLAIALSDDGSHNEAVETIAKAIAIGKQLAGRVASGTYDTASRICWAAGRLEEAREYLTQSICLLEGTYRYEHATSPLYLRLAVCDYALGDRLRARRHALRAEELARDIAPAHPLVTKARALIRAMKEKRVRLDLLSWNET